MENEFLRIVKETDITKEYITNYIDNGGDINITDRKNRTALIWSVINKKPNNLRLLLEFGANPDLQDGIGRTAIFIAVVSNHYKSVELLINYKANPNKKDYYGRRLFFHIIKFKKMKIFYLLLKSNKINLTDYIDVFLLACYLGHLDMVKEMSKLININMTNREGQNGISYSVKGEIRHKIIKFLLDNDINIKTQIPFLKHHKLNKRLKERLSLELA